jgi:hypothetical protein
MWLGASASFAEEVLATDGHGGHHGLMQDSCGCEPELSHAWVTGEYLLWWFKDARIRAPLLVTGDENDPLAGFFGEGTTQLLFGNEDLEYDDMSGVRLSTGYAFAPNVGAEIIGMWLPKRTERFEFVSDASGRPLLARPFFDTSINLGNTVFVAAPDFANGRFRTSAYAELWGAEANVIIKSHPYASCSIDWIVGLRYADLEEDLDIVHNTVPFSPNSDAGFGVFGGTNFLNIPFASGDTEVIEDRFRTQNRFFGTQLGLRGELQFGNWFINGSAKVALGSTRQIIDIRGRTTLTTVNNDVLTLPGAILAQTSNIGRHTDNEFSVLPEVGINLGYQAGAMRVFAGYSFMYWTNVVRPGDQLDRIVDFRQSPIDPDYDPTINASRPAVPFKESNFWAQGINLGLEYRW